VVIHTAKTSIHEHSEGRVVCVCGCLLACRRL
jgi:hypothetical protein